ncbi:MULTISPECIES: HlyD family type I secretion periplasmic adaptor subunit [Sulfurospirillum]|jgi:HlyD family secretion protein/adhesin transport system membrane fusion protein|uniref:HlyD family type I secretion periplasmic adaptor subunit n=1 Tax=Sulfurospirillum TaxID=57665 RepID=UPI0007649097|nr:MULTISPECIES: HlyD family type I secretion periplasmic adaptor subunit [Sulfurospirillum]MCD8543696.1 HlyD family type I secretion periplasmic adaptor subunit [Sulfurospirillum cavolei]MCP3651628.1 HlyD family type I secretion periplasmic adaptor subunit [Sulfurospirillum sp. DNRA8]MCR1810475.1 HlyD family type I secretion periplasmic adaptor subunit [Sulfurospirillum sp. DNRA8]
MLDMMIEKRWSYYVTVVPIGLFFVVFFLWSAFSHIDEVVRGSGKAVPSGQTKVLQHLEGGIVSEILVKEGDTVKVNQPIYQLNQAFFTADLKSKDLDRISLLAKEQRLMSLIDDKPLVFEAYMSEGYPEIVQNEMQIFKSEKTNNTERLSGVQQKVEQRQYELKELEIKEKNLSLELNMAKENVSITEQLMKSGAGSRKEYLFELSKKQNLITQIDEVTNQIPITQGKYKEAVHELGSVRSDILSKQLNDLQEVRLKLTQLSQQSEASIDRTNRLLITSPVNGIVNILYFHTIGGTIKPGDKVAEITPLEEGLTIEANIKAADRGRIWVGQKANIEITAYDYAKYGMIEGELISISPDSFTTQKGDIFYAVKIKADKDRFGANLPIMPGMEASINIITGKRTVLEYILLPLKRMGKNALMEP